jgi:hypothetical protein
MKTTTRSPGVVGCVFALFGLLSILYAPAQITNTLFFDDFSKSGIDTSKYAIDAPFFEGGVGDIAPKVEGGVLEFTGTVSQQWWAGATLRLLQSFPASAETNIVVTVDRVSEAGVGTASRSALWIMDFTKTRYVLYADVRGEGGWRYNRYIGESGDVRTGSGNNIAAFDGYDDQAEHQMGVVINGQNLKLYLDGMLGETVKFPFSPVIVELGSYARANGDTADTIWDNLKIEAVGTATFSISSLTMGTGQTASNLVVRIPPGANANRSIVLQIVNLRPAVATPVGALGNTLSLTFDQGGPNTKTFDLQALAQGSTQLSLSNTVGLLAGNTLSVVVTKGPAVLLEDTFSGAALDASKWRVNEQAFETGTGVFEVTQAGGALQISGYGLSSYWSGASIQTVSDFTASKDLPLVLEVDRVSMNPSNYYQTDISTGARSGVFITSYDTDNNRTTPYVFFSQDLGSAESPTGWVANASVTGAGTALPPLGALAEDTGKHRMKVWTDGARCEVFLDDVSGGSFDFPLGAFIKFELAAYARDIDDSVKAVFDNVKIENALPCIAVSPAAMMAIQGDMANSVTVTIPKLLNVSGPVKVTVTSRDPNVAEPVGASNGSLTLDFPTGTTVKSFNVAAKSGGSTLFDVTNDQGACVTSGVSVSVTPPPTSLVSDDFSAAALDTTKWSVDTTPLVEGGTLTEDAAVIITNGMAELAVTSADMADWPGFTVWTKANYTASADSPIVFEIDRVKMEYVLVGGNTSKQRVGIWVKSGTNYVFFSEFGSYDATSPGWQYHRNIGQAGDVLIGNPNTTGTYISQFSSVRYLDQQLHRVRMVVNGATAKLYLDGVLGVEVSFPFSKDLVFGFGAYANYTNGRGNIVNAFWDNAVIQGFPAQPARAILSVSQEGANIVISWTGTGTLQSTDSLSPINWKDVTPAPAGNSYTVTPAAGVKETYYRVRQ